MSSRRAPALRVARAKDGEIHQVVNEPGAPEPLSGAPWMATESVPEPPEVKVGRGRAHEGPRSAADESASAAESERYPDRLAHVPLLRLGLLGV